MTAQAKSIDLSDVQRAAAAVARVALRTPVVPSPMLTAAMGGGAVWLKLENLQVTGSFKVRGAAAKIACLDRDQRARGIVTCSSGNHGRAVAYVAEQLGIPATVCVPQWVDPTKLQAIRSHGAEAILHGRTYDEAEARSWEIQRERDLVYVHPFDDPDVIAGQGTIGLEINDQIASAGTIVVPLSGGGLIGGIAIAVKAGRPETKVIAVSAASANVMYRCIEAGEVRAFPEEETIAGALAGGIGKDNRYSFSLARDLIDEHVLVTEQEIRAAMLFAAVEHKVIVEGGGAVALAAALHAKWQHAIGDTVLVVSGGNIDSGLLRKMLAGPAVTPGLKRTVSDRRFPA